MIFNAFGEKNIQAKNSEFTLRTANKLGGGWVTISYMERSYKAICQRDDLKTNYNLSFCMVGYKQDKVDPAFRKENDIPGRVAQSVTCLATDACLTAIPGVASSISARSHMEIDHEIIYTVILLPSADSFKKGCCQLQAKVCAQLLVNRLFKPAQEKVWLGELTVPQ